MVGWLDGKVLELKRVKLREALGNSQDPRKWRKLEEENREL